MNNQYTVIDINRYLPATTWGRSTCQVVMPWYVQAACLPIPSPTSIDLSNEKNKIKM
jgi:hypothetical protein